MHYGQQARPIAAIAFLAWTAAAALAQAPPPGGTPALVPLPAQPAPAAIVPPPLPTATYYIADNGKPSGPMSIDEVKRLAQEGAVTAATLVWKSGTPDWTAARNIPELSGVFPGATAAQAMPQPAPAPSGQQALAQPGLSQPGFGQADKGEPSPSAPPPAIAPGPNGPPAQAPNYADESTDFGIRPQRGLQVNVGSPTPTSVPGARIIATRDLADAIRSTPGLVLIDVLATQHAATLQGALRLSYAGRPGSFRDRVEQTLAIDLSRLTRKRKDTPIVLFCLGSQCWESYNAVLRTEALGYTNLYWYRGGLDAWQAAGLPMRRLAGR